MKAIDILKQAAGMRLEDEDGRVETLRDKWAGTFVIRRKAKPIGTAPIQYKRIGFGGVFLIFPEADRARMAIESSPGGFPDVSDGSSLRR